jgi:hypothetical protein
MSKTDGGAGVSDVRISIKQIRAENHRVYYRVFADDVELPSMVCIFASQKNNRSDELLTTWCKDNAWRLETGTIIHADLIDSDEKGRGA